MKHALVLPLVLALAACSGGTSDNAAKDAVANAPAKGAPAAAGVEAPPATAATPPPAPAQDSSMPAPGVIGYAGFGPAHFGADEEHVRMAWGADLGEAKPTEPGGCYRLTPQPKPPSGYRIAFMLEGNRFARIDVDAADIAAPGGGRVGMGADEIGRRYAGHVQQQNHKYVEGAHYLRIADAAGGPAVLVFETDATDRVTSWRIGVPPQVDYVEGCS